MPNRSHKKLWLTCPDCGAPTCPPSYFCNRGNREDWPDGCDSGDPIFEERADMPCPGCGVSLAVVVDGDLARLKVLDGGDA